MTTITKTDLVIFFFFFFEVLYKRHYGILTFKYEAKNTIGNINLLCTKKMRIIKYQVSLHLSVE